MVGLRQGCILSPCLFSFYISDFPDFLARRVGQDRCEGVQLHDTIVCVLMYADDMALVAHSPEDLQRMLNALHAYCSQWHMFMNVIKTKVVVFHKSPTMGRSAAEKKRLSDTHAYIRGLTFLYNGEVVEIVSEFKYLGIVFYECITSLRRPTRVAAPWPVSITVCRKYTCAIEHRLKSGKAVLAKWMRRCKVWKFDIKTCLNLFYTCVMPAFEYGVGLWGPGCVQSTLGTAVEQFWLSNARYILNAPLRAPIAGIQGELGWLPFSVRAGWQASCILVRATCSDHDSLLYKAACIQRSLLVRKQPCWLANMAVLLQSSGPVNLKFWNDWWSGSMFSMGKYIVNGEEVSLNISYADTLRDGFRQNARRLS